jgi:two-component system, chemotaxis family, response regulator Rcp1
MPQLPPEILLVDDNPADLDLEREALARTGQPSHINSVKDGEQALAFLRRQGGYETAPRPDLVVLDLNLPRCDGRQVLAEAKTDAALRTIPIVVFTTSHSRQDIQRSYELGANCYVSKPGSLQDFLSAVQAIEKFWFGCASVPAREN